jgi:hypothetical protein
MDIRREEETRWRWLVHRWRWISLVALGVVLGGGCESYDQPHRSLSLEFEMRRLGGELIGAEALRGRPWVIHLWVPR